MVVHEYRLVVPCGATVLEVADQLLLLRVDAHDWPATPGELLPHFGDVGKLLVTIRSRTARELLVVDPKREPHLLE